MSHAAMEGTGSGSLGSTGLGGTATTAPDATVMSLAGTARPGIERVFSAHADLAHLAHDRDLTGKIMRKRQEEMQRRTKLLDPRKRQFGVDHSVLDAQLNEKRAAQDAEVDEEGRHAEAQLMQDHVLQHLEGLKQSAMRERQKAANDFSLTYLRKEDRREYAISDPHALKKDVPIDVDDERLGKSSFQRFEGQAAKDPRIKKRMLQAEQREWLQRQMQEKLDREQAERDSDRRYDMDAVTACQVRSYCEQAEREERRRDKIDEAVQNKELAQVHNQRRQAKAQREKEEKDRHVENVKVAMSEDPDWKLGSHGKLLKTEYKRLTVDEEQEVYNTMAQQVIEKQHLRHLERSEQIEEARATTTGVAVLSALEGERDRQQKARLQKMVEHNKMMQAAKHRADDDERRKYRSFEHEP